MANTENFDALSVAEQWVSAGKAVVLATLIETWSSAPLPVGSQMVIDADGNAHGSLSRGCVEDDVVAAASSVINGGTSKFVDFRVSDDTARRAGLSCGGRMQVYIEWIA